MTELTHLSAEGNAQMVDISTKPPLYREAVAHGEICLSAATLGLIEANQVAKGHVFSAARLAGIMAAKRTGDLIPLCHPLSLSACDIDFQVPATRDRVIIIAATRIVASTGVEMEALTAVAIAALTIYDMCKAVDKGMVIGEIRLLSKTKRRTDSGEIIP